MRFMLLAVLLVTLVSCIGPTACRANDVPSIPFEPNGDHFRYRVYVEASRSYGVVPFEAAFKIRASGPTDLIKSVRWDVDSDGLPEAAGDSVSLAFDSPRDYALKVTVETLGFGTYERTLTVSGYSALMSITFDDGSLSNYSQALPLLESRGVEATAYIVPTWVGLPDYMHWDDVSALYQAGWDIGSHSMTHQKLPTLADSSLDYEIRQSQIELQSRGFPARHFAAPHCRYDDSVVEAIRQYYDSNRVCEGINPAMKATDPYRLLSFLSYSWRSLFTYRTYIDSAIAVGGWAIMANHEVAVDCTSDVWCLTTQMLADVVDYAIENRVKIVTVDEALRGAGAPELTGIVPGPEIAEPVQLRPAPSPITAADGSTEIEYTVFSPVHLEISLYDVTGRRVRRLFSGRLAPGEYSNRWDGRDSQGRPVGSGSYFYILSLGDRAAGRGRIIVLR